jgi:hypothetical protein
MSALPASFQEARFGSTPIRNLNLAIEGTDLEDVLKEFERERERLELKLRSHYYLSTEWGVPFGTVSIAIPFYLARRDLRELHAEKVGDVEGASGADILRYLRHELGHVVNYAYKLYEREDWLTQFGSITQPYRDDYRPEPFSPRFVRHLPGWYEDWAETFAVWMTPGLDWKTEYQAWPIALGKLNYCERIMGVLKGKEPLVTITELDEDVAELTYSVEDFYQQQALGEERLPPGLDGAVRAIFDDLNPAGDKMPERTPASTLIRKLLRTLPRQVYRWTGHFPERTQALLRHLAERADQLNQVYRPEQEAAVIVAITTLVTSLAMNYVYLGSYLPRETAPTK